MAFQRWYLEKERSLTIENARQNELVMGVGQCQISVSTISFYEVNYVHQNK